MLSSLMLSAGLPVRVSRKLGVGATQRSPKTRDSRFWQREIRLHGKVG